MSQQHNASVVRLKVKWCSTPEYVISQLWGVTCNMGSRSVICHPTRVYTPNCNHSRTGYLPHRDGRPLSWPRWLVAYRDGLPTHRGWPISVLNQQCTTGSQTRKSNSQPVDHKSNTQPLHYQATHCPHLHLLCGYKEINIIIIIIINVKINVT